MKINASWITAGRISRIAIILVACSLVAILGDGWRHLQHGGVTDVDGELLGRDFVNLWAGGKLAIRGRAADAYNLAALHDFQTAQVDPAIAPRIFPYPPTAILLALPFAIFGYLAGLFLWTAGGLSICAILLSRLLGWKRGLLAAMAPPAVLFNIWAGQNGAFSAAFLAGGILLLEEQPVISGILFGALCFKPQLAILVPVALFAGRHWRTLIAGGCTVAILTTATIGFFGWDCWSGFSQISPSTLANLELESVNWKRMPSIYVMTRTLGVASFNAYMAQGLATAATAIFIFRIWRSTAPIFLKGSTLILGVFLATPYAWDYDLVMITFALAFFGVAEAGKLTDIEKYALSAGALLPLLSLLFATLTGVQIGPVIVLTLLSVVYWRAMNAANAGQAGLMAHYQSDTVPP